MQNSAQNLQPHTTSQPFSAHGRSGLFTSKRVAILLAGAFLFAMALWITNARTSGATGAPSDSTPNSASDAPAAKNSPPDNSAADPEPPPGPSATNTNTTRVEVNGQQVTVPANGSTSYTTSDGNSTTTVNVQHSSSSSGNGSSNYSSVHTTVNSSSSGSSTSN